MFIIADVMCLSWTKEEMDSYVKLRKSLASKSKS